MSLFKRRRRRYTPTMERTLAIINLMQSEGIIKHYAIGGAVAATFYIEPVQTFDLDVFVFFPILPVGLVSLSPIYRYLSERGYVPQGEAIIVEGWPIQFLPVFNPLTEEAMEQAISVNFGSTPTRVFTAEHLAAIMLQTGRPKDHARLLQFLEAQVLDQEKLRAILLRHELMGRWENFRRRFLTED